jgi:branched-chain amino acid transport system substrate-binding protein
MPPYIVRVSFTLWQMSLAMGKWAAKNGYRRAISRSAILSQGMSGSRLDQEFHRCRRANHRRHAYSAFPAGFAPLLQRIKDAKPQTVFTSCLRKNMQRQ